MIWNFVLVGLGGALGVAARFGLVTWLRDWIVLHWGTTEKGSVQSLPIGSLLASILGCFLVGLITQWTSSKVAFSDELRLFLITGFCSGFAALAPVLLEATGLFRDGNWLSGGIYLLLSILLPLVALALGLMIVKE